MKDIDFLKLVKSNIRSLRPYETKEIPCRVKLDANESPYCIDITPDKKILQRINRYPDPEAVKLKKAISMALKVNSANILLGNGSDELIYYLITAFGGPVLYPIPTFSMYGIISQALGEKNIEIPLNEDFDLDIDNMLAAIKKYNPKLIFLSSPNNPTGNCFSAERILKIIETSKGIVIADEAYQPFSSDKGFLPLLKDYRNLAILRTLSKIGFAGLRVGFLLADKDLINEVNKVRLPFNLNALSQAVALEAFKNKRLIESQIKNITSERERLFEELSRINNVSPYPSEANFILFKTKNADIVFKKLIKNGVLVRNLSSVVKDSLRVTIGTHGENNFFIKALKKSIGGKA
ncbi:histidinol-phosphate aminotransferase [Dissulfurispira thermophila]|uniref:Histidinol-phosphate aminotransferase n=2 Tax=root TaxID=1 RepID=A0A7G1H1E5_9BACT|nr:histidinol-phosphate transaminase [Dissulfurispira thermophila]BCB95796.1 histidinol-phosphate aminotransferase [Dissulfurispira thermophila]